MKSNTTLNDLSEEIYNALHKLNGVDQLETYCASNRIKALRIVNNEILETKQNFDSGIGVRIIKEGYTGYASTTSLTLDGAQQAYGKAVKVARSRMGEQEKMSFAKPQTTETTKGQFGLFSDDKLRNIPYDELTESGKRMIESAMSSDKRVVDCSGSVTVVSHEFHVLNSNGVNAGDMGDYVYATLTCIAKDGEQRAQGFDTLVTRKQSVFADNINMVGEKAAGMSVKSLGAKQPPEGKYDIVYTPSCLSITMGNLAAMANARRVQDGISMFTDLLGKQVASSLVNVVEDGRYEDGMDSVIVDDEGLPTRCTTIIENGVLRSFFYDSYTARKAGTQSTGNGFRVLTQVGGSTLQGKRYDFPPLCASSNFVILPGDASEDEIVQDTKHGILLGWTRYERLLNSRTGSFTVNARGGNFMIIDGELKYPLQGFRVHDNYMNLLKSIDAVASNIQQKGHWGLASISPTFRTRNMQIISL